MLASALVQASPVASVPPLAHVHVLSTMQAVTDVEQAAVWAEEATTNGTTQATTFFTCAHSVLCGAGRCCFCLTNRACGCPCIAVVTVEVELSRACHANVGIGTGTVVTGRSGATVGTRACIVYNAIYE